MCTRSQLAFANAIEPGSRRAGFHLCSALAAISEYCGRTGQNPNACLASALSQERNHYTPAYPRPRRQALWNGAAPGHAAAPLGPLQTCSSGTLATRTALHLLMLGKTAAACHFILAWSRTVGTLGFASISTASVELLQATRPFGAPHGPETKQATYRLNWDTRSHELGHESLGLIDFVALCPTWDCTSSPHY
jgi:hypothetical protein